MSTTAQEFFIQVTRTLSPPQRLRLANLILNDLVDRQNSSNIDRSDCWTDEDQGELTNFSLQYAAKKNGLYWTSGEKCSTRYN